eukprot:gene2975-3713_t
MQTKQHTLQAPVTFSGVGIHSDCTSTVTCLPAPIDHGIKFQRTDIEGQPIVEAIVDHVVDVTRSTTLRHNNAYVDTVEHLLAAISGLEIDNILIQLDGPEVPILDGSALPFVKAFQEVGLLNQNAPRRFFSINESVVYTGEKQGIELSAFPLDDYKISVMVGYDVDKFHNQHAFLGKIADFPQEIASSRTFAFLSEIQSLYEHGLIRGGNLDNALVIVDKDMSEEELGKLAKMFNKKEVSLVANGGVLNNVKLQHPNEPARHKLLDLVGDLALVGRPIKGYIAAHKPGHASNIAFARKLRKLMLQQETLTVPTYDPMAEPVFDIKKITKMLPHRYPFQLVDKIIYLDHRTVTGIKNVTINEPFFQGHFPGNPIMPGVLQIEAIVQTGGMLVLSNVPDPENYATYFLAIENCRFRKMVVPGDTLIMHCELLTEVRKGIVKMRGRGFVGNKLACEAVMTAQIVKQSPFTYIAENVTIGEGTWIGPHVTIFPGARIGKHCQIFPGAVIAAVPQDLKFKGEESTVEIGDHTVIRECVTINRGTAAGPHTIIGNHVLLMAYVHVAHDCNISDHVIVANAVQLAGHVTLAPYVRIGGTAALRQFVKVGAYAMIGGGTLVKKDIPPFVKVAREPLSYCGINVVGLKRLGFTPQQLEIIQTIYRYIFQQALPLTEALAKIEEEIPPCWEKETVLQFIQTASLGIVKHAEKLPEPLFAPK